MKSILPALLTILWALPLSSEAQLIFATNNGIFERVNGQSVRIDAGSTAGLFPGLSRNGRFLSYSRPDLVTANGSNGLNPSSDLVLFDRATNVRRVVVDNDTTRIGADFDPLSSQVSPDGRVVAYGVRIGPSFGTQQSPTTSLIIADFATGLAVSEPLAARNNQLGPTSDTLSAEFRGLSFFPNSNSFVTPVLSLVNLPNSAAADPVSTITRFDRQPDGQWAAAASLSTPQVQATGFVAGIPVDAATNYQIYPAISPNGAGLAYFDVFRPSRLGGQPSSCAVVLANADGSNARILTSFNPGFLPTGLTWTTDGTALIASISEQINLGTGFLDLTNTANSAIFNVPVEGGSSLHIAELGNSFAPVLPASLPTAQVDLSGITPALTRSNDGSFLFRVPGLPPFVPFEIQSSSNNGPPAFTRLLAATGAELANGIALPADPGRRLFRLAQP